jgi:antitoxin component YwqK of YwqJK toxin-antitoxin module
MKKIIYFIFLTLLIAGCKSHTLKVIKEKFPDGTPRLVEYIDTKGGPNQSYKQNTFYPSKKIQSEGEVRNGKMNGKWTYYYENGKKWSEGYFKDGLEEGLRTTYYENGQKRYEGYFIDGKKTGNWKFWDEKGNLIHEIKN